MGLCEATLTLHLQAKIKDLTSLWSNTTEWGFGKRTMQGIRATPLLLQSYTESAKAERIQQIAAATALKPPIARKTVEEAAPAATAKPPLFAGGFTGKSIAV
jgi:hypothetical protein